MADADFERAFGSLAYAELEQKAPGLFPYLVGFQMVKKTDDETHAIGVFGFKVGDQWYYCPVFWLNGKIKGYDLLYIVSQDLFVPLQESWINYITNRKPYVMGEAQSGSISSNDFGSPDFTPFVRSPITKRASQISISEENWFTREVSDEMYKSPKHVKYAGVSDSIDLSRVLTGSNPEFVGSLLATMQGSTKFAEAVYKFYSPAAVLDMSAAAKRASFAKQAAEHFITGNNVKVEVKYDTGVSGKATMDNMSAEERQKMLSGDAVVKDNRTDAQTSQIYAKPDFERTLTVPNQSGIWDILLKDTSFEHAIVICDPATIGKSNFRGSSLVVIPGKNKYVNVVSSSVHARNRIDPAEWDDMYNKFNAPTTAKVDDIGCFIDKSFNGTFPFRVKKVSKGLDWITTLCVEPYDNINKKKGNSFLSPDDRSPARPYGGTEPQVCETGYVNYDFSGSDYWCDNDNRNHRWGTKPNERLCSSHHIQISEKASGFTNVGDTLIIGTSCKFVPLGKFTFKEDGESDGTVRYVPTIADYEASRGNLNLGSAADIESYLFKCGMHSINVKPDLDDTVSVSFRDSNKRRLRKNAALKYLVEEVGLREKDASVLIKLGKQSLTSGLVKLAEEGGPMTSYDDVYRTATQQPYTYTDRIDSGAPGVNVRESMRPIDPEIMNQAEQAAAQGQKDVFDLSVLQGLIRATDIEEHLSTMLKDIILGNDRVGRILFMYYWHFDQFAEKFGDEDMKELEDTLRNVFKSTGDLILFLKQKSISPNAVDRGTVDIGEAPAAAGI